MPPERFASMSLCRTVFLLAVKTWRPERVPTRDVVRFRDLELEYFYYGPDGEWTLREDPVDLNELAAKTPGLSLGAACLPDDDVDGLE
jgi:hypothetical protein